MLAPRPSLHPGDLKAAAVRVPAVRGDLAAMRRSPLTSDPEKVRAFQQRAAANSTRKRRPVSPASPEQREKVRDRVCVECASSPCDPAHLTPRSLGGCDHPDCVVPLCRDCHRAFDLHELDLEPVLALRQMAPERSHMAGHMSLQECIRRLRGER